MLVSSSRYTTPPDPAMVFLALSVSKSEGQSASSAVITAEELPPGMIALSFLFPRIPPQYSSSSTRKVVPIGASCTPGSVTCPLTAYRRVPPFLGTPTFANQSPPFSTMTGRFASVSTLLTAVGCLKSPPPALAGKGGLRRGYPFRPSSDSSSAVSSPQMYAPAPTTKCTSRSKPDPTLFCHRHTVAAATALA